ncbi:hypothetical protein TNCT_272041 [Trichonephila clavata]|uniref:Uncharacterized protein n=1 Tax=Trichonephila clavata TaxID=2740835 RepID=A0A8X6IQU7_TRICU|nr:hypothetical protein TNCT_272041 [Trichonephila clavata]
MTTHNIKSLYLGVQNLTTKLYISNVNVTLIFYTGLDVDHIGYAYSASTSLLKTNSPVKMTHCHSPLLHAAPLWYYYSIWKGCCGVRSCFHYGLHGSYREVCSYLLMVLTFKMTYRVY